MHYVRFLKSPRIVGTGVEKALVAKVTVTTDLGERFLAADVGIAVDCVGNDGDSLLGPGREYIWKGTGGMRSLEVSLPISGLRKVDVVRMVVRAKREQRVESLATVLGLDDKMKKVDSQGGIVTVKSMEIDVRSGQAKGTGMAERVFRSTVRNDSAEIHIWEETGESIARHIWYARNGQVRPSPLLLTDA
jgi:hypothetical protein